MNIWENNHIFSENALPPSAVGRIYANEHDALSDAPPQFIQTLNGEWDFLLSDLRRKDSDMLSDSGFSKIRVPMSWQCAGFDKPVYVNRHYEFVVDPPYVPADTLCGIYKRVFTNQKVNKNARIYFDGVDSGFSLYINEKYVGYSQGSHMTSAFDITDFLTDGENRICVAVYKHTDGSYLETQDKWRLSGIFRDVYIEYLPDKIIDDFTVYANHLGEFSYKIKAKTNDIAVKLFDKNECIFISQNFEDNCRLENIKQWTAETPYLYTLLLSTSECTYKSYVGFRTVETKNGQFYINGVSIKLKGVNRHDFHPVFGAYVPPEHIERDIKMIKQTNINMIRCSHYPNTPYFYELCDKYGIYVMAEADIETHGMQLIPYQYDSLSSSPDWTDAYLDRAARMYEREKNHPCVVIWSLGNESGFGMNQVKMSEYLHSKDKTRPVHYMHASDDPCVDIVSKMYPKYEYLIKQGKSKDPRPFFMNEFAHAMGNSPGGIKSYMEIVDKYPRLIGGALWEWCEQGLHTVKNGRTITAYGGDFDEENHDENLCIDGIVTAERTPRPSYYEYKQLMSPIKIELSKSRKLTVYNKYDFTALDNILFRWTLYKYENKLDSGTFKLRTKPHSHSVIKMPFQLTDSDGLRAVFTAELDSDTPYAKKGHIIHINEIQLTPEKAQTAAFSDEAVSFTESDRFIHITDGNMRVDFDKYKNKFINCTYNSTPLFENSDMFSVWRAPTDNDRAIPNPPEHSMLYKWQSMGLDRLRISVRDVTAEQKDNHVEICVSAVYGAKGSEYLSKNEYVYKIYSNGIHINAAAVPNMRPRPERESRWYIENNLPRLGICLYMNSKFNTFSWYGKGAEECYCDRCESATTALYTKKVHEMHTPYVRPQENGNRTDVRYAQMRGGKICVKAFYSNRFDTSVTQFANLESARHNEELKKCGCNIWHIDMKNSGLGTNACGPMPLEEHRIQFTDTIKYDLYIEFSNQ